MWTGDPFRTAVLLWVVLVMPVGVFFRARAHVTGEDLQRRAEGLAPMILLRLVGLAGWVGVFAYLIDPASMAWAQVPLPDAVRWAGVVPAALSLPLLIWTFRNLGKNLTDTVGTRAKHMLVTTGPYRWVRHPFYVCLALAAAGLTLLTANVFLLVMMVGVGALIARRTAIEEDKLLERFGDDYRNYMRRTGRYLPRLA